MNAWLRFRWAAVTLIGAVYCFVAPRSFYRRRPK